MLARHVLDATDEFGRQSLGRLASMTLRGGGRLYVQTWTGRGRGGAGLVPMKVARVQKLLERHGGTVLDVAEAPAGGADGGKGSVGKVVAQWD
jgi:translation elongation factor EF-G